MADGRKWVFLVATAVLAGLAWLSVEWTLAALEKNVPLQSVVEAGPAADVQFDWGGTRPINLSRSQYEEINYGTRFSRIAVGQDERVYAAWEARYGQPGIPGDKSDTMLAHSDRLWRTWPTPEVISPSRKTWSEHADAAVDASGNVHLVWHERLSLDEWQVLYRKYAAGGSLLLDRRLRPYTSTLTPPNPTIALGGSGYVHAVWLEETASGNDDVVYSRSEDGGNTWTTPVRVYDATTLSSGATVEEGGDGRVYVAWNENVSDILARRGTPQVGGGIAWGAVITPSAPLTQCVKPSIVVAGTDMAISWGRAIGTQKYDLHFARCPNLICSTPVTMGKSVVVNTTDPSQSAPVLALGDDGTLVAAWHGDQVHEEAGSDTLEEILFTYSTDGGQTWAAVANVSRTPSERSIDPNLALRNDVVHVVWKERYSASLPQKYDTWYINTMKYIDLPLVLRNY